jgi:serine/threonine protein kinase/Tol biopolymer transport system component
MTLENGTILNNRYRIVDVLGQGGMGAVYRAIDDNLEIDVAVKENLFLSDEFARQFRREATVLATLRFTNLPRVIDYFVVPGQGQYLVMDYIAGEDLRERMERVGTLPEEDVIRIGIAICEGLNYLHTRSSPIVHRDVKPGNVKITPDGQIVLVDFGLVKVMSGSQTTTTGARAMTPGYSPPEQYGTARTDSRSDIYSLAATLYVALTGVIPEDSLARATGNAELTPLRKINPKISRRLAVTIEKGLALTADERYQSALEFKYALINASNSSRHIMEDITIAPAPYTKQEPVSPFNDASLDVDIPDKEIVRPISKSRLAKQRQRRRIWQTAMVFTGLIAAGLVYYFLPDFTQNIRATIFNVFSTPTPLVSMAETGVTPEIALSTPVHQTPLSTAANETSAAPETIIQTPTPLAPTATPMGGGVGEIAFVSNRTGTPQIFIMKADGTNQRQITNTPDGACQPAWSPDGMQLVFVSPCRGDENEYNGASLYIINYDGSGLTPLPIVPGGDFDPSWSPDGNRIAFTSLRDNHTQIYIYNLIDRTTTNVSDNDYSERYPAWSPTGTLLAFVRKKGNYQVWIMTDNGDNELMLSQSGNVKNSTPVWSPDGQAIFFVVQSLEGKFSRLASIRYEDRFSHKENRIPASPKSDFGPVALVSFSPDGFWLAYESWPDGRNHDIYVMTPTGSNIRRLTTDPSSDSSPAWRP